MDPWDGGAAYGFSGGRVSTREELAQVIVDALEAQEEAGRGGYCRIDGLDDACLDGYFDLLDVADAVLGHLAAQAPLMTQVDAT